MCSSLPFPRSVRHIFLSFWFDMSVKCNPLTALQSQDVIFEIDTIMTENRQRTLLQSEWVVQLHISILSIKNWFNIYWILNRWLTFPSRIFFFLPQFISFLLISVCFFFLLVSVFLFSCSLFVSKTFHPISIQRWEKFFIKNSLKQIDSLESLIHFTTVIVGFNSSLSNYYMWSSFSFDNNPVIIITVMRRDQSAYGMCVWPMVNSCNSRTVE